MITRVKRHLSGEVLSVWEGGGGGGGGQGPAEISSRHFSFPSRDFRDRGMPGFTWSLRLLLLL